MVRGAVLDSPSKGKMTETCVAEGAAAMLKCEQCDIVAQTLEALRLR